MAAIINEWYKFLDSIKNKTEDISDFLDGYTYDPTRPTEASEMLACILLGQIASLGQQATDYDQEPVGRLMTIAENTAQNDVVDEVAGGMMSVLSGLLPATVQPIATAVFTPIVESVVTVAVGEYLVDVPKEVALMTMDNLMEFGLDIAEAYIERKLFHDGEGEEEPVEREPSEFETAIIERLDALIAKEGLVIVNGKIIYKSTKLLDEYEPEEE
jgi:hypothetical protein